MDKLRPLSYIQDLPTPVRDVTDTLIRTHGIHHVIKLSANENPLGASSLALQAMHEALLNFERYPDSQGDILKEKLAVKHALKEDQVIVGNGSHAVLERILRTYIQLGDEAIISQYAYGCFAPLLASCGAQIKTAPAYPQEHSMAYGHDVEMILATLTEKTRVILIANPNNPTGTWLSADQLEGLLLRVPHHVLVIIDEAYFDYVTEEEYPDTSTWLEHYPNLVVIRTFSKIHGLAGLRIGYGLSSLSIAKDVTRIPSPYAINTIGLAAAAAAIEDEEQVALSIMSNQSGLLQWLDAAEHYQWVIYPGVANFIRLALPLSAQQLHQKLLADNILVMPLDSYQLPQQLRISIGLESHNQRCIDALHSYLP